MVNKHRETKSKRTSERASKRSTWNNFIEMNKLCNNYIKTVFIINFCFCECGKMPETVCLQWLNKIIKVNFWKYGLLFTYTYMHLVKISPVHK